jgi:hypothetical protein
MTKEPAVWGQTLEATLLGRSGEGVVDAERWNTKNTRSAQPGMLLV